VYVSTLLCLHAAPAQVHACHGCDGVSDAKGLAAKQRAVSFVLVGFLGAGNKLAARIYLIKFRFPQFLS